MAFSRQMGMKLATRLLSKSKITNVQFVRIASLSTRISLVHGWKQVNSNIQSRSRQFQLLKNEYGTNGVAENLDQVEFENVCSETLDSLTEYFEELVETEQKLANAEVSYSNGVLNIDLGNHGTYVINRQSPNKQIWLSSPVSGPKRYDYIPKVQCWVYKRDAKTLHQLLQSEISEILGDNIDMSKCAYSIFRH